MPVDDSLYRLLVESVRDYAIFALDSTGHVLTWNRGAERLKGYTGDEIIGRHFSTFYPEEEIQAGKPDHELVVAAAQGWFEDEGWRIRKDGSLFWANVIITALRNAEGELVGFAKVTRDLTERRAAQERALADARRVAEAEAANRARAEFVAALSHELRTPLNAIAGYVDLLLLGIQGPVSEQQVEALRRIQISQQRLLGIINDLLNFSRIEAGRVQYDISSVVLSDTLQAVRSMVEPQAADKGIEIDWPKGASPVVRADAAKLEQIILNLLVNAIKFTERDGHISVTHTQEQGRVHLHVRDTGIGIPPDKLERIFEPFVQVGRSLSTPLEGTGLGLAISRDLARAMGGDISVSSQLAEGSTFTLSLPAEAAG